MQAQNSKAKILAIGFEKQMEVANKALEQNHFISAESKIMTLERILSNIKEKDPSFDASHLEKQFTDFKMRCHAGKSDSETSKANDKEQFLKNVDTKNQLDIIERSTSLSEVEASQLLALDISTIDIDRYQDTAEEYAVNAVNDDLPRLKSLITEVPIVQEALIHYNRFVDKKRYWQTVSILIPNSNVLKETYLKFEALDKELGGEEGVKSKAKTQYMEYLNNIKMPKAVVKEATAESIIKKAYEEEGRKQGYNRTLIKINLLENDWTVLTKPYTGVIVGRKRSAAIAFKNNKTGECILYRFFEVYQQYNGSGYSNGEGTSTNEEPIPCENIN